MAARLGETAKTRKSLPLTERDLASLARLREETPEREALAALSGIPTVGDVTESVLLHLIFGAGLRAIQEKVEEYSYTSEAETRRASGEAKENRRLARRRRPAWAVEE